MQSILLSILAHTWWLILIRGLAFLAFGLLAFTTPWLTIGFLITYWAIYLLIDGGVSLASTLRGQQGPGLGFTKGTGILSIGIGLLFLLNPQFIASVIIMLIGWALLFKGFVLGSISLNAGFRNRGSGLLLIASLASIFLGYWIVSHPEAAAATMLRLFSLFAILIGLVLSNFALKLRKQHQAQQNLASPEMQKKQSRYDDEPFIDV